MTKKTSLVIHLFTITVITLLITACSKKEPNTNQCTTDCLQFTSPQLSVKFNTSIILVEQVYTINVQSQSPISQGKLSGVNMNMGELPLTFNLIEKNNQGYHYQSRFILGICSEPEMQWQLSIKTQQGSSDFNLTSYWQEPQG